MGLKVDSQKNAEIRLQQLNSGCLYTFIFHMIFSVYNYHSRTFVIAAMIYIFFHSKMTII
jgi:hypothetical protein